MREHDVKQTRSEPSSFLAWTVSQFAFHHCDKYHEQNQFWEEKLYLFFKSLSQSIRKVRTGAPARAEAGAVKKRCLFSLHGLLNMRSTSQY